MKARKQINSGPYGSYPNFIILSLYSIYCPYVDVPWTLTQRVDDYKKKALLMSFLGTFHYDM